MRLPLVPVALAVSVLLAGACGGDDGPNAKQFGGEEKDVAAVIDDLQSAARDGDPERICEDIFTSRLEASIKRETGTSCPARVRQQLVSDDATFTVDRVRVAKRTAVVNVSDGQGVRSVLYMSNADDEWRIAQIAS